MQRRRFSKVCAEACPALKTAWRIERRIRRSEIATRAHIWLGTYTKRGQVYIKTSVGVLRIVHSGAIRRAIGA